MRTVGTALAIPGPVSVSLAEIWGAAVRLIGAARPLAVVVVRRPLMRIFDKRQRDIYGMLQAENEGELNALILKCQPRWRREAMVFTSFAMVAQAIRRRSSDPTEEFGKLEEALYKLLGELDTNIAPQKVVAAEMLRVAAISSLRSARTMVEHAKRRSAWPDSDALTFSQISNAVQTPLMYACAVVVGVTTDEFDEDISIEILNELARRTLEASDALSGIVGLMRDDR